VSASGAEAPFASGSWEILPRPRVVTPAYYYNFVEFVFIPLKKEPSNYSKYSAFASSAFLHLIF